MPPNSSQKIIIILWHWKELSEQCLLSDDIYITDDNSCKIIRVNDTLNPAIINRVLSETITRSKPSDEIILFLHDSSISTENVCALKQKLKNEKNITPFIKFITFGGGKGFIYFNPATNTGLLGQKAGFPKGEKLYAWKELNTGKPYREKLSIIVGNKESHKYKVKDNYFHSVWLYYNCQPKKTIFELQQNLYIHLLGNEIFKKKEDAYLIDFVKGHWLEEQLLELLEESIWQVRIPEFYKNHADVNEAYNKLVDFIKNTPLISSFSKELRTKFMALLHAMPEKTYV